MRKAFFPLLAFFIFSAQALAQGAEEPAAYRRIISLYAAHTEVLLRLGAKDQLIGVSTHETYKGPETENFHPQAYSLKDDVEKFLAAKPDLVLVRPMHLAAHSHVVEALRRAGIKVEAFQVVKAAELYEYWRALGALAGKKAEAEKMIDDFDQAIAPYHRAAEKRQNRPGVFVESTHQSVRTFTPDSIPMWLVSLAGGTNVAADAVPAAPGLIIADYGPERLLAKAGKVDIFISQSGPMNLASITDAKERGIYQPLKALKDGKVYQIPEEIFARPTPSLLEGLKLVAGWTGLEVNRQE